MADSKHASPTIDLNVVPMAQTKHAAQVVKVTGHTYELDEAELERVLMKEEIQDLPVAVVSVAGVYRAGKSFLLNFFLRYLTAPQSQRDDGSWLSEDSKPLEGFSWKGGSTRNTTGILLWSEPIIVTLPDGQKAAVLLMDTQGTFDSSSTFRDCSTIFALSILLSSVQIYNLFYNINENDLQYLEFFTVYGKKVSNENDKPFQVLEFLVRDWQYPYEHDFGEIGGGELLEDRLKVMPDQPKELRELREQIRGLFEKVSCFLMPHPGFAVMNPKFKGAINEISPDFRTHLKSLVTSLFSPEKLLLKKINGNVVNARELCTYFKTYMKIFNSNEVPAADTILKATAEAGLLAASNEARRAYEIGMEKDCGVDRPSVPISDLEDLHRKYIAIARDYFTNKKKMGSKEDANRYLQKLLQDLEPRLSHYKAINLSKIQKTVEEAKKAYENFLASIHGSNPLCVHPIDLEQIHNNAVHAAIQVFDAARVRVPGKKDDERTAFIKSFEQRLQSLQLENVRNNKSAVIEIRLNYYQYMQAKSLADPPLGSIEFKQQHEIALEKALQEFKDKRNQPDSYTEDVFKYNLIQAISSTFSSLKLLNQSKNKVQIANAVNVYNDYIGLTWHREQCLHPQDLINEHKNAKCRALVAFKPSATCAEGYNFNDEDQVLLSQTLEARYEELRSINETANQEAIQYAFGIFKSVMEKRLAFSWWWLLIIPLFQTALSVGEYVEEARGAAIVAFRGKRRPGAHYTDDIYLEQLNEMIDSQFTN